MKPGLLFVRTFSHLQFPKLILGINAWQFFLQMLWSQFKKCRILYCYWKRFASFPFKCYCLKSDQCFEYIIICNILWCIFGSLYMILNLLALELRKGYFSIYVSMRHLSPLRFSLKMGGCDDILNSRAYYVLHPY